MASIQKDLNQLCTQPDTRKRAREIYLEAQSKTQPGSSYALSKPQALLPICAVLASMSLRNQDVKEDLAHLKSCVTAAEFKTQLLLVQHALAASPTKAKHRLSSFEEIGEPYDIDDHLLISLRETDDKRRLGNLEDTITSRYAVLCWVLEAAKRAGIPSHEEFCSKHRLKEHEFTNVHSFLEDHCSGLRDSIARQEEAKNSRRLRLASTSPKKSSSRPEIPLPAPRQLSRQASASSIVLPNRPKRTARSEIDIDLPESPTKRLRTAEGSSSSLTRPSSSSNLSEAMESVTTGMIETSLLDTPERRKSTRMSLSHTPSHGKARSVSTEPTEKPKGAKSDLKRKTDVNNGTHREEPDNSTFPSEEDDRVPRCGTLRPLYIDRRPWHKLGKGLAAHFEAYKLKEKSRELNNNEIVKDV